MSGTLFVVATPIGNLEDITLRALRVLREVDAIAAEDTRRTARLLARHGILTPTLSFHAHNTRSRLPQLLARLVRGENLALVTDAGMPGISDPGLELVHAVVEAGLAVDVVPGASAPLTAAVASGFPLQPLTIFGFPPTRSYARTIWLKSLASTLNTLTFFEAPHRIRQTLVEASSILVERPIVIGRELTKVHQEFLRGTFTQVIQQLTQPRGEYTVVIGPAPFVAKSKIGLPDDDLLTREFWLLTNSPGTTRREAIRILARRHGVAAKVIYAALEKAKSSVK
jgi:16S rRNA (cytidine1402-2'-O)-methyltransferase